METDEQRPTLLNHALLFLAALIWGSSFSFIKIGVMYVPPISVAAGRLAVGAAVLLFWLLLVKKQSLPLTPKALRHYLVVGFFGSAFPFSLIGWGEQAVSSALAAVLMGVMPIATFVLAHFVLKDEPLTFRSVLGVFFGFLGLLVLVGVTALQGLGAQAWGQLAIVLGAVSYAVCTVYIRRYVDLPGLVVSAGNLTVAAILTTLAALLWEVPSQGEWLQASFAIAYLGVFPTAVASLLLFYLVGQLGATKFSQINYLIPVIGSVIGMVFMGEAMQSHFWLALVLILLGISLVRSRRVR